MKNIHLYELEKYLKKKLNKIYVFLGEDYSLLQKNQDLIITFAHQQGFIKTIHIDIEKYKDWEKVLLFYKKKNLFFQKNILVINITIQHINMLFIKKINMIFASLDSDILILLKLNHLSYLIKNKSFLNQFKENYSVISCYTPNHLHFILWIKYEIKERKIQIEEQALLLIYECYTGNTLFVLKILDIIEITWPNTDVKRNMINKIIIDFFDYSPLHWINYIFQFKTQKAITVLYFFYKKKYNPLILVRALQKDLLKVIYIKREKLINMDNSLKRYHVQNIRYKFFMNAVQKINFNHLLQAIQMLVKIEINIKKEYDCSVWNQLQELTLILNN